MRTTSPRTEMPIGLFIIAAVGFALLGFAASTSLPGCSSPCEPSNQDPSQPSLSITCASGELCYQGSCFVACNAGQERSQRCENDGECEAPRGTCSEGFCTACESGLRCIPNLNLCQPLVAFEAPPTPPRPTNPPDTDYPLDGGAPDGALTRIIDAGDQNLIAAEITNVATIDLGQEVDYSAGATPTERNIAQVHAYDVEGNGSEIRWRPELSPPAIQCEANDEDRDGCGMREPSPFGNCDVRPLRAVTAPPELVPEIASVGDINVTSDEEFEGSINADLRFVFNDTEGVYNLAEPSPLPEDLYVFSLLTERRYLSLSSQGESGITQGGWPIAGTGETRLYLPIRLEPIGTTLDLIQNPPVIANPPANDLIFQWTRIDTGVDPTERVRVRITGTQTELFCEAVEGIGNDATITITVSALDAFREAEAAGGTFSLAFERASSRQLAVNPATAKFVIVTAGVRYSLVNQITFQ